MPLEIATRPAGIMSSILDTVGNTPAVRINNIGPEHVELYVKIEAFNPMGSVKDRLALGVIEAAERDGSLQPGQTVIEATSGNTGIGLAMVCAQKGYPLVVTMAENFSVERRKLMRFLGARVILTPASDKGSGMIAKARDLAERNGWFLTRQFENEANADIHTQTTAREIIAAFGTDGLDYWVTGAGTGGTLKGVARVLKAECPATRIVAAEPDNAQILASGIAQPRNTDGSASESHPLFRPHLMQGWTPDFIPKLASDACEARLVDIYQPVEGDEALHCARELARREGILCGTTGGATFAAALKVAETARAGSRILAMLPDTGERYLTTPLFAEIADVMTAEEQRIADMTPRYRFGSTTNAAAGVSTLAHAEPAACEDVRAIIADPDQPVVMFALQWCEFCWSARKLFEAAGVACHSLDLDSAPYREGNRSTDIRNALHQITGAPTIPQIFIGGHHIGGATELFDAFNDGRLAEILSGVGLTCNQGCIDDAYTLLPNWLHPR